MKNVLTAVCAALALCAVAAFMIINKTENYLLLSIILLVLSMLPFFASFEHSKPTARELALISSFIALAVVSRAAFYLIPQVKPIAAVVIIGAVCLGARSGYMIGAFSAFISNFIFGQGAHTPFQMVALGLVGFVAGLIFKVIPQNKYTLSAVGFVLTFALYGVVADTSTVMFVVSDFSLPAVLSVYAAGVTFSLVFAATTAVCLFIFGEPFIKKLERINIKYGLYKGEAYGK